jgi:hypothetical protein
MEMNSKVSQRARLVRICGVEVRDEFRSMLKFNGRKPVELLICAFVT